MRTWTVSSTASHRARTSSSTPQRLSVLAVALDQVSGGAQLVGLAQEKDDLDFRAGLELERGLDGGAGIEGLARGSGQTDSGQRGGSHHRSVTAHKLGAVGGDRSGSPVDVGESHAGTEVGTERVARQESAGLGVDLGHDMHRGVVAGRPQDPLGIVRRRQLSPSIAHVLDPQPDQLDRVIGGHQEGQLMVEAVRVLFKGGIALTMTHQGRLGRWNRQRRWAPDLTAVFVSQVDDLARRVRDRVVAPGCQPVRLAVSRPGKTGPALGDQETETGVGDNVAPWGGGQARINHGRGLRLTVAARVR